MGYSYGYYIESPDNTGALIVEGVGWSPTPKATKLW